MSADRSKMFRQLNNEQREFIHKWLAKDGFIHPKDDEDKLVIKKILRRGMYNMSKDYNVLQYYRQRWIWLYVMK